MKRCQACGYVIDGEAREDTPESVSGARPTMYWHLSRDECTTAKDQRIVSSPLQRRPNRL